MADPAIQRMLAEILAGQERARLRDEALSGRMTELEGVTERVISTLLAMSQTHVLLREAIEKLAAAATQEKGGSEVADALRAIQGLLAEQGVTLVRAAEGVEALPGVVAEVARRAAEMAFRSRTSPP